MCGCVDLPSVLGESSATLPFARSNEEMAADAAHGHGCVERERQSTIDTTRTDLEMADTLNTINATLLSTAHMGRETSTGPGVA